MLLAQLQQRTKKVISTSITEHIEGLTSQRASRTPLKKAAGLKRAFLMAMYRWKFRRLYSAMSSRIRGNNTKLKNLKYPKELY